MASTWTNDGIWEDLNIEYPGSNVASNPSLSEVEAWLEEISAQFDIALGSHSFVFPISSDTSPTAYKAVSKYVSDLVSDLCNWKNSSGRFFTEKLVERGITPMAAILKDMNTWIEMNADGLVADHVQQIQKTSVEKKIQFRVIG